MQEEQTINNVLEAIKPSFGITEEIEPLTGRQYEFDQDFQTTIAALVLKDSEFNNRVEGLVRPEYFENIYHACLVNIVLKYFSKYKKNPQGAVLGQLIKEDIQNRIIRPDLKEGIVQAIKELREADISDVDYVVDQVAEFAKHQSVEATFLKCYEDYLPKRDFTKIEKAMEKALSVGATEKIQEYEYFERIRQRSQERKDVVAGLAKNSVSTGLKLLDARLKHKGWGYKEMSILMGPAKSGKSTGLIYFAKNAVMNGENVLYITLEVSTEVTGDRLDSCLAEIQMVDLNDRIFDVQDKIEAIAGSTKLGKFYIEEYPPNFLTPRALKRILQRYKSKGITFNLLVVDYLDTMIPNEKTDSDITNSKNVWLDMRALAITENIALLSATQTNREGMKAKIVNMTHASEDINKMRIADLVLSINKTEEEAANGEARLFFAASRNQKGMFSIRIKQNLEEMRFIQSVLGEC